ncbi:helix-turn-helix domain-containing protein [Nocardia nepalensis]|uniref:helix-turn-helix domain-containing protein n=1 Tax=Nocardia nepalensis TaxID=3375448 RepID=UPI003B67B4A6
MPRKTASPASRPPRSTPAAVRTSGSDSNGLLDAAISLSSLWLFGRASPRARSGANHLGPQATHLTQADFAALLGLDVTTIYEWESGRRHQRLEWQTVGCQSRCRRRFAPPIPGRYPRLGYPSTAGSSRVSRGLSAVVAHTMRDHLHHQERGVPTLTLSTISSSVRRFCRRR